MTDYREELRLLITAGRAYEALNTIAALDELRAALDRASTVLATDALPLPTGGSSVPWTAVKSSNVAAVRYDDFCENLDVAFKNGGVYRYSQVPRETYDEFLACKSLGTYLAYKIKPMFKAAKVEDSTP